MYRYFGILMENAMIGIYFAAAVAAVAGLWFNVNQRLKSTKRKHNNIVYAHTQKHTHTHTQPHTTSNAIQVPVWPKRLMFVFQPL